jgi:hypothetical protein
MDARYNANNREPENRWQRISKRLAQARSGKVMPHREGSAGDVAQKKKDLEAAKYRLGVNSLDRQLETVGLQQEAEDFKLASIQIEREIEGWRSSKNSDEIKAELKLKVNDTTSSDAQRLAAAKYLTDNKGVTQLEEVLATLDAPDSAGGNEKQRRLGQTIRTQNVEKLSRLAPHIMKGVGLEGVGRAYPNISVGDAGGVHEESVKTVVSSGNKEATKGLATALNQAYSDPRLRVAADKGTARYIVDTINNEPARFKAQSGMSDSEIESLRISAEAVVKNMPVPGESGNQNTPPTPPPPNADDSYRNRPGTYL